MVRLIILGLLFYLLYRVIKTFLGPGQRAKTNEEGSIIDEMVQDPYCKTYIPLRDAHRKVINGREFFFCGKTCADKFLQEMKNGSKR